MFLYDFKMFQRRFYGCSHLFRRVLTRTFQFVHSIRCIVHRQAEFALYFSNICHMNFEAVIFLNPFLNLLICYMPSFPAVFFFPLAPKLPFYQARCCQNRFSLQDENQVFCGTITTNVSTCFEAGNISYGMTEEIS